MNELTLKWIEANQLHIQTFKEEQPSKYPGRIRIGRDPHRCDVVLSHPTVSGLPKIAAHAPTFRYGDIRLFLML
ncbi:FHA domain-containing protein [Limnoraphis robusta]|uniref:FHA domain-containing protein n=1 Tax=Limnoraphis robusta TaxID=1118279 RepID=UPI000A942967|nr:FHA domain-containing protein [Limnoraphis robusta]